MVSPPTVACQLADLRIAGRSSVTVLAWRSFAIPMESFCDRGEHESVPTKRTNPDCTSSTLI